MAGLDKWLYNMARRQYFSFERNSTTAISLSGNSTTALSISGTNTTGITISGTATTGMTVSSTSTTGVSITGTKTTALSINSTATTALLISGALTKGIDFTTPTFAASGDYGCLINSPWISIPGGSGFGAKLMFSNSAATVLYGLGICCRTAYAAGKAVGLNVTASTAVASSGGIQAIQGHCQIAPTFTVAAGSTNASCALYGKSLAQAACAAVLSSLWIDEGSTTKATTHYLANFTMNGGAIVLDAVFHVYGGTQTASKLFSLEGGCGVSAGSTKSTPGGVDKWLDITIDSVAHYVPCYTSKTA